MASGDTLYNAYLTRRMTFSAAHRLHSNKLSDEVNVNVYGKCNHRNGHGHNYIVEVTVYGPVDPVTGMVMNMTDLKHYMEMAISNHLDHKNLDADVEYFHNHPSTTENVAIFIWNSIQQLMEKPDLLYEVKVHETENNVVIFRGHRG